MYYDRNFSYPSYVPGYMPNETTYIYPQPQPINDATATRAAKEEFFEPVEGYINGNLSKTTYNAYKGYNPRMPILNTTKDKHLFDLSVYGFAVHELSLYLDIHSEDQDALNLLSRYSEQARKLKDEYEKLYGPLDYSNNLGTSVPYEYQKGPWPWERI